jgi:VanZ family protein
MAPRSRHRTSSAAPLAWAYAAVVLYASLYPFSGWRWPPGQDFITLLALPWPPWRDPFDQWANLLGYLPWGLLCMLGLRSRGLGLPVAFAAVLLLTAALSYATEVTQNFLPGRHPSLKDWAMNTAGGASGATLAVALQALGATGRWGALRERWFVARSGGGLALLALWPAGLIFPAPVPLGLGHVGDRLRDWALRALSDVPWASPAHDLISQTPRAAAPLTPLAEGMAIALGLLAPCVVAFAISMPGWRRLVLVAGAAGLAVAGMTLSTLLNFGPQHAWAWLTPAAGPALAAGVIAAALLSPLPRRVLAAIGLVVITGGVMLVAQAPADPYYAVSLQAWEQGRFAHFHGVAQWIGWLWPYTAMLWLLVQVGARE